MMTMTDDARKGEKNEETRPKIESFDDILPYIGEASRYQLILFIVLLPFTFAYAFLYFVQFFMTLVPENHWCHVPEFGGSNFTDDARIALSIPFANVQELTANSIPYSRCEMYDVNYTEVLQRNITLADPSWPKKPCGNGWDYNHTMRPYGSIAAELDWVCDKDYLVTVAQSAFFFGSMIGGIIFGYIADHYGRIPALVSCNAVGFFASIATAFANNFWSFTICRLVVGTSFDNCFNILCVIVIEYVSPKYRTLVVNMSLGMYFATAGCLLPWIAYWIADWRILSVVSAVPLVAAFVAPWIVPESARWYIMNGETDKAIEMLKKFEKVNRKIVDPEIYVEFRKSCNQSLDKTKSGNQSTVIDIFKNRRLGRITVIQIIWWIILVLVFDGHLWNMKLLYPDVFTAFSLTSMTEFPAAVVLTLFLDRWGRRWMGCLSMFICTIFSFIAIFTPAGGMTVSMAIVACFGVNVALHISFQWSTELLPTVVRAQGVSLIHTIGYSAHIIAPYIIYLARVSPELPLIVLGVLSLISTVLALLLPETLNQELPEILEEGNNFGKEQSFWWIPCFSGSPEKKKKYRKKLGVTNAGFNPGSLSRIESTRL